MSIFLTSKYKQLKERCKATLLFNAEQIVGSNIKSVAEENDLFVVKLNFTCFVFAVTGLIFIEVFRKLILRKSFAARAALRFFYGLRNGQNCFDVFPGL